MELNVRRVRIAMMDRGVSIQSLSKAISVHPSTISRWLREPTKMRVEDMNSLAMALGLTEKEIVSYGEDQS